MSKNKDQRARTWASIVYPESAPKNWREILDGYHVPWVESPLHDKDVNPDGEVKKAHWHVVLFFDGKKSFEQIKEITDALNAPIPQKTANAKGLVRYLIHMDNPEKYQYKRDEIICHCGAEIDEYFALSSSSRRVELREMIEFISDSKIDNFDDFLMYCIHHKEFDWFDIAVNHNTLAINKQLDSIYQKNKSERSSKKSSLELKVAQVKEMSKRGMKQAVIADTVGISLATVKRYLKK